MLFLLVLELALRALFESDFRHKDEKCEGVAESCDDVNGPVEGKICDVVLSCLIRFLTPKLLNITSIMTNGRYSHEYAASINCVPFVI